MDFRAAVKKLIPRGLFVAIEPYGHLAEAFMWNVLNGFPGRGLKVIGVTGTNGKTTTSFLIHRMLHEAGYKVGLMSTVGYGVGDDIKPQMHHMTNVSVPEMMQRLKYMRRQKVDWLVLETTSHALAQHRVFGVSYQVAVMTNVTHEHLVYHRTFKRYVNAKRMLFKMANKHGLKTGVINADDPSAELFASDIKHPILYQVEPTPKEIEKRDGDDPPNIHLIDPDDPNSYFYANSVKLSPNGVEYTANGGGETYHIKCQIPGSFNIYNSLAAVCVGRVLGLTRQQIEQGIAALPSVEGRMNNIDEGQDFTAIVDYAHSPDSFEKLFKDIKPVVKGKLIVLFGSLGGGDKGKRPLQGELAGHYADEVIVCEEDDRQEDPQQIAEDIAAGVEKAGKTRDKDLFLIHDRVEAINFAVKRAAKGDTVLLLGKGHEKTIEHADGEHPWDEVAEAHKALKNRLKS